MLRVEIVIYTFFIIRAVDKIILEPVRNSRRGRRGGNKTFPARICLSG